MGGFQQALRQFLHNGAKMRSDVLPPLIRRLEELVYILGRQDAARFYTTSLLLLYEGDEGSNNSGKISKLSVKLFKGDYFCIYCRAVVGLVCHTI